MTNKSLRYDRAAALKIDGCAINGERQSFVRAISNSLPLIDGRSWLMALRRCVVDVMALRVLASLKIGAGRQLLAARKMRDVEIPLIHIKHGDELKEREQPGYGKADWH